MMSASVLAVGDSYLPVSLIQPRLSALAEIFPIRYITVDSSFRGNYASISEHQGDVGQIASQHGDEEVLLVHAAPVTAELLDACPSIRLIACARGNPLNVDLAAAEKRGVTVINTPAKNADAVADLTMTFVHQLMRAAGRAANWLETEARNGETHLDSTFIGGQWMAREPRGSTMGIIGFGAIGRKVAAQAEFYGMRVLAYDPFAPDDQRLTNLTTLLSASDVISLHAKATEENRHLIDKALIATMKPGVFIVNTARQTLIDETALLEGIATGHVAGAALDVCEPDGEWPALARHPRVILTPHIGGATAQTQERALDMLAADIDRYFARAEVNHRIAGPSTRVGA
jgi:phosphoglycerate dehydrogenase-like enzyme